MIKSTIQKILNSMGYDVVRTATHFTKQELGIMKKVKGLTATGPGRLVGLMDAVKYVTQNKIPGAIVECGVWRGGSMMAAMYTLLELGDTSREFYLFDTFEGMSPPTEKDVMFDGTTAESVLVGVEKKEDLDNYWCYSSLDSVRQVVLSTGYPSEKVHFVKGPVEETLPEQAPSQVSLLRLDTDWYESTKHEMECLYPRLVEKGVLIIDDYGHWQGAKKAVDEYFNDHESIHPLLGRLDYTGRLLVKPSN